MPFPIYETREEYVRAAGKFRPKSVSSIVWAGELEKGWISNCRRAGREPYPPHKGELSVAEKAEAEEARERARRRVDGFLEVFPTCALTRSELVAGVLAEEGRDPCGRKR